MSLRVWNVAVNGGIVAVVLDLENNGVRKNFPFNFNIDPAVNRFCSLGQQTCLGKRKRATREQVVANRLHCVSDVETIGVLRDVILLVRCDTAGVI